jgi:hypothetical protein
LIAQWAQPCLQITLLALAYLANSILKMFVDDFGSQREMLAGFRLKNRRF